VTCISCQRKNSPGAAFCGGCGAALAMLCTGCEHENPPDNAFCERCGRKLGAAGDEGVEREPRAYTPKFLADKILQSRAALEGERKQVTVLFADVKGSVDLSSSLDPEDWHAIMERFLRILAHGVHRFEGTVNQYTGDGIMALFGAPVAHEDHAQRACYAALHLQDELRAYANELRVERGLSFAVRMGLNSGEVVVGKIGDDLRMDYTAQGQTVGLAARMEQIAEPGRTYLADDTASLCEGYFELEDLGPTQVRGIEAPIGVFALRGVGELRTRLDVSRARGFSGFVGRDEDMAVLESALERAIEGNGQVVGIVADAGLGKSRLCFEFVERCRARGIAVQQAHAVPHGKSVPLLPILELLRANFGIEPRDSDQSTRDKIAGRLLLRDASLTDALPFLFEFMGVPDPERPAPEMEPPVRERRLLDLVQRLTRARSEREPAVLLLEDLHWMDEASDRFVASLADAAPGTRTLVVANFRPEYRADWMQKSTYQQLALLPLGREAIHALLEDLLGTDGSLDDLPERIAVRTEGNPFFIEEAVLSLAESGFLAGSKGHYRVVKPFEEWAIPRTVQSVLASRIDLLAEREKRVLETAAVVGDEFGETLLAAVVELSVEELEDALRALVAAEFLLQESLYPEPEFAFKHPLTREVAYGQLLGARREELHARVARSIEAQESERLDERAALLAHHWELAGQPLDAAHWHLRAALWAGARRGDERHMHYQKVRELLGDEPEDEAARSLLVEAIAQTISRSMVRAHADDDLPALIKQGHRLAAQSDDPGSRIHMLRAEGTLHHASCRCDEAARLLREARQLADDCGDRQRGLGLVPVLTGVLGSTGPLADAIAYAVELVELLESDPDLGRAELGFSPRPAGVSFVALWRMKTGAGQAGRQDLERALALARETDDPVVRGLTEANVSAFEILAGDPRASLSHSRRAAEYSASTEPRFSSQAEAPAYLAVGRYSEAAAALERGWRERTRMWRLLLRPTQALTWLGLGDAQRARTMAQRAVDDLRESGARVYEIEALLALAKILIATEGEAAQDEVAQALVRATELSDATGARLFHAHIHELRSELMGLLGGEGARVDELREAQRLFADMGADGHAARIASTL
jgi:class 3 adenylate cyclase/tetratricopeptide (TPR) repeat protein